MKIIYIIIGIMIPFIGTSLGSSLVFFIKEKINKRVNILLIGFAVGVMLAASIWSLLIPSINIGGIVRTIIGLVLGFLFLIVINNITKKHNKNINMLNFSVTLHNIPEGMAVGVCFAGFLLTNESISLIESILLSIGIALQNIPEGAIISVPLRNKGKLKSFICGVMSGIVEPIAAFITIILLNVMVPLLPYLLSFASGCMLEVIINDLIKELDSDKSSFGLIGVLIGFIIMMGLDNIF